ncbi:MAG: DUF2061 domain-containing protein [Gammaproteobacteria bacterium]
MVKTMTFAAVHMTVAFCVVYVMTGSFALGGAVALIEPLCNTAAYFFHEQVWERLRQQASRSPNFPSHISGGQHAVA